MPVAITGYELASCLGNRDDTFKALLRAETGLAPLRFYDPAALNVSNGYQIVDGVSEAPLRATRWLTECIASAARQARLDPRTQQVSVVVGTGLRELRMVERWSADGASIDVQDLHFARAVRAALPRAVEVITLANACSASGHALAVGQDMLEAGEADAVVVAGCDSTTESMLAMIGRVADRPTSAVRPFDKARAGVLLGEGAVAVVLQKETEAGKSLARLLATGLSCDAHHETAPHLPTIVGAMRDAHARAGVNAQAIGLVLAHGTGTALNDPTEAAALREVFAHAEPGPLITGIKGAIGHTSGAAALMNLVVAIETMLAAAAPAIVGLATPIDEVTGLRLVVGEAATCAATVAQVNAFGFGGVNAVSVVEVTR